MNNKLYGNLIFELSHPGRRAYSLPENRFGHHSLPDACRRAKDAELPECDEMTVVRHYTNHSENNFGVDNGFYPLGSCTMKYNPVINEEISSLKAFTDLHPQQPVETVQGALEVEYNIQRALASITGMADVTLNPYAGAHGELTGLMIITSYHQQRGDTKRTKVIVPDSAHGTNPASAAVCGLEVVEVKSTPEGLVDVNDLRPLLGDDIAGMMMTNPNTLGLFEKDIPEIAKLVHDCGGLLYYDGANLNPLLGAARPGDMGFDVIHLNLHKTFSTPHGGGGPGSGPVGVCEKLIPFLPKPHVIKTKEGFAIEDCRLTEEYSTADNRIGGYLGNFLIILAEGQEHGRDDHGRSQASARLRLPCSDHLLPAAFPRGHDDRADRERKQGYHRRLHQDDARHRQGSPRDTGTCQGGSSQHAYRTGRRCPGSQTPYPHLPPAHP